VLRKMGRGRRRKRDRFVPPPKPGPRYMSSPSGFIFDRTDPKGRGKLPR